MKKIAIYGAGGLGRELAQMIGQINACNTEWYIHGYFDDHIDADSEVGGIKVLGGIRELNHYDQQLHLIIAIADNTIRRSVVSKIDNENIHYPVLIHPSAIVDVDYVKLGEGSVITAGNILTTDIDIGRHCIVNLSCTIGHDVTMGDYCSIMPGVHISGNVKLSNGVLIGTGANILQNLSIGSDARVGAGAVVTKDVNSGNTVVGVPARILENHD